MVIFKQFFHVSFWLVEDRWHYIPETKTSLSCMAGGFVGPGRSVSERRSREGLGKDNGRTNVNLLLEKRERDWTELTFAKISEILATVTRDGAEMTIYIGDFNMSRRRRRRRRRRQRERQKSNRFNRENNNSARASRFFVHFFAVPA